jgi:hypothetical protein
MTVHQKRASRAISRSALIFAVPLFAVGVLEFNSSASAEVILSTLGPAGPDHWAILSLGGNVAVQDTVTLNGPGTTVGNVGATSTTDLALNSSSPPAILGNVYMGNTSNFNGSASNLNGPGGQIQGTIFTNQDALLNPAAAAAFSARTTFDNMANTFSVAGGSITGSMTLTANLNGPNVTDLSNITLGNNEILTLDGAGLADAQFVINFNGVISLNGSTSGGKILLTGGLTTHDVVFNYTGSASGDVVKSSGGSSGSTPNAVFNGVFLVTNADVNLSPGVVYGEIIGASSGNKITLVSGSEVINPPSVPVPASLPAGAILMGGIGIWRWRKNRKSIN